MRQPVDGFGFFAPRESYAEPPKQAEGPTPPHLAHKHATRPTNGFATARTSSLLRARGGTPASPFRFAALLFGVAACIPLRDLDSASAGRDDTSTLGGEASAGTGGRARQLPDQAGQPPGGAAGEIDHQAAGVRMNGGGGSGRYDQAGAGVSSPSGGTTRPLPGCSGASGEAGSADCYTDGPRDPEPDCTEAGTGMGDGEGDNRQRADCGGPEDGGLDDGRPPDTTDLAPPLPELPDAGVAGSISAPTSGPWTIGHTQVPALQIRTPTATYSLLQTAGAILSMLDASSRQWIDYNDYRPSRGFPSLGGCCKPGDPEQMGLPVMTTTLDKDNITKTHVRAISVSSDGAYHLVWDFYVTHVTITVNRAVTPFSFKYQGVPGRQLDPTDKLVLPTGEERDANAPWSGDLPGPDEWVYLADPKMGESLFLIRHGDDGLTDSYVTADQDSAKFVFGDDQLTTLPIRFSIGLIASTARDVVTERIRYITTWIH